MGACFVDVVPRGIASVDHQTIHKLHRLGSLAPQLARHNNLTALGPALHYETEDAIAGPSHSQSSQKLVAEGLTLCNSTQAP